MNAFSVAFGGKADMRWCTANVCFCPKRTLGDLGVGVQCHAIPSASDTQLLLDVSHHRVRQARLAEFHKVLSDDALPYCIIRLGHPLPFVGKVERFSFVSAPQEHECVRPVSFD